MHPIKTKRIYDDCAKDDGHRVLVDRIWPRGISKEKAKLDDWCKEIAPSSELRKWFNHKEDRFDEFRNRYKKELKKHEEDLKKLREIAQEKRLCLLFGAKDKKRNQAVVLKEVLEK